MYDELKINVQRYNIQGGPKKVQDVIQRKGVGEILKYFFDGVFLSINSHLLNKLELSKLCRKQVMGLLKMACSKKVAKNITKETKSENCTGSNREKSKLPNEQLDSTIILQNFWGHQQYYLKSFRNSKSHDKGDFTSKSNSNKIKLCGGDGGNIILLKDFNVIISFFRYLYKF